MEDLVELADLALSECGLDVVTDEELARRYESRAHETDSYLVCRLLLEKKKSK